jgi:hypothetical protein
MNFHQAAGRRAGLDFRLDAVCRETFRCRTEWRHPGGAAGRPQRARGAEK